MVQVKDEATYGASTADGEVGAGLGMGQGDEKLAEILSYSEGGEGL